MKTDPFSASERSRLTEELYEEMRDLIETHATASTLTIPEVIGVIEMLKHEILMDQFFVMDEEEGEEE